MHEPSKAVLYSSLHQSYLLLYLQHSVIAKKCDIKGRVCPQPRTRSKSVVTSLTTMVQLQNSGMVMSWDSNHFTSYLLLTTGVCATHPSIPAPTLLPPLACCVMGSRSSVHSNTGSCLQRMYSWGSLRTSHACSCPTQHWCLASALCATTTVLPAALLGQGFVSTSQKQAYVRHVEL